MLSKEEIENFIQEMTEVRPEKLNKEALRLYNTIMQILDRNKQLETENKELKADKQRLIEKLEKDIKNNNFRETECLEDKGRYYYSKEILENAKGEK